MQARAEEAEFRRARERLTLKHRNTSRWARRTLKRGVHLATEEQQEALHEQLRLSRELRAKASTMEGHKDSESRCALNKGS
jgi:U3 small nucleolar RNA-associated protein 14